MNSTILAIDLGKFNSVFCRFDPDFRAESHPGDRAAGVERGDDGLSPTLPVTNAAAGLAPVTANSRVKPGFPPRGRTRRRQKTPRKEKDMN